MIREKEQDFPQREQSMWQPLVSVIIPVYNGERYIDVCIQSVIDQTYSNLEILVVDDGSTDGTCERVLTYGTSVSLLHQKNSGVGAARNFGIRAAKGEYIALLDADDTWHKNKIEKQMEIFTRYPSVIAVGTDLQEIDPNGRFIRAKKSPYAGKPMNMRKLLLCKGIVPGICPTSIVMIKEVLIKAGLFPLERDILGEDHDCWIRLSEYGEFYVLPGPLGSYRLLSNSLIHSDPHKEYHSQVVILERYKRFLTKKEYKSRFCKILTDWTDEIIYQRKDGVWEKLYQLFRINPLNLRFYWLLANYMRKKYLLRERFEGP